MFNYKMDIEKKIVDIIEKKINVEKNIVKLLKDEQQPLLYIKFLLKNNEKFDLNYNYIFREFSNEIEIFDCIKILIMKNRNINLTRKALMNILQCVEETPDLLNTNFEILYDFYNKIKTLNKHLVPEKIVDSHVVYENKKVYIKTFLGDIPHLLFILYYLSKKSIFFTFKDIKKLKSLLIKDENLLFYFFNFDNYKDIDFIINQEPVYEKVNLFNSLLVFLLTGEKIEDYIPLLIERISDIKLKIFFEYVYLGNINLSNIQLFYIRNLLNIYPDNFDYENTILTLKKLTLNNEQPDFNLLLLQYSSKYYEDHLEFDEFKLKSILKFDEDHLDNKIKNEKISCDLNIKFKETLKLLDMVKKYLKSGNIDSISENFIEYSDKYDFKNLKLDEILEHQHIFNYKLFLEEYKNLVNNWFEVDFEDLEHLFSKGKDFHRIFNFKDLDVLKIIVKSPSLNKIYFFKDLLFKNRKVVKFLIELNSSVFENKPLVKNFLLKCIDY